MKQLQKQASRSQEEIQIIFKIINLGNSVANIFYGIKELIDVTSELIYEGDYSEESLTQLMRYLHTLKGNSRIADLTGISNLSHHFESYLEDNRNDLEKQVLVNEIESIKSEFNIHWDMAKKMGKVGEKNLIQLDLDDIDKTIESLQTKKYSPDFVREQLVGMVGFGLEQILNDIIRKSKEIGERLGKAAPVFEIIEEKRVYFKHKVLNKLKDIFGHLVRNSLDHGLETIEAGQAKGKSPDGTISIKTLKLDGTVRIEYWDDGKGLNLDSIKAKGIKQGLISETENDPDKIAFLIFNPGFSTKTEITMISGRGVGLDAIKNFVEKGLRGMVFMTLDKTSKNNYSFKVCFEIPLEHFY